MIYSFRSTKREYDGVVSLVITLFIILVISLITLSFAAIMRREQRTALDRQLNSQAFYAAETGINDAIEAINTNPATFGNVSTCSTADQDKISTAANRKLDANAQIEYTCVFVDQTPTELNYQVKERETTIIPLEIPSCTTAPGCSIEINWQRIPQAGSTYPAPWSSASGTFSSLIGSGADPVWSNTYPGMLRGVLLYYSPTNRSDISASSRNFLTYPSTNSSAGTIGQGSLDRAVVNGGCQIAGLNYCRVAITGIQGNKYALVLRGIYKDSNVMIRVLNSSSVAIALPGAQAVIDSTGKAGDVVRRMRVFKPLNNGAQAPGLVLDVGDDICKRMYVNSSGVTDDPLLPPTLDSWCRPK